MFTSDLSESIPSCQVFIPTLKYPENAASDYGPGLILRSLKRVAEYVLSLGFSPLQEYLSRALYSRYLLKKSSSWMSPQEVVLEKDYLKLHIHQSPPTRDGPLPAGSQRSTGTD